MDAKEGKRKLPIHADGFAWVKYGEKTLSPSGLIREYYKCRNWRPESEGGSCCPARKVVDGPRRRGREQTAILGPATPREGAGKEHSGGLQHNHSPPQQKGKGKGRGKGSPKSQPGSPCLGADPSESCWTPRQLAGSKRGSGEDTWLEADGSSPSGVESPAALEACLEGALPHPLQALSPDALTKLKQELLLNPPESPASGPKRCRGDGMSSPHSPSPPLPPLTPSPQKGAAPLSPSEVPPPLSLLMLTVPAQQFFTSGAADMEVKEEAAPSPSVQLSPSAVHFSEPAGSFGCQPVHPAAAQHLPPPLHLGPSVGHPQGCSLLDWECRDMEVGVASNGVGSSLEMERDDGGLGPHMHMEHGPILLRAQGSNCSSPREQQGGHHQQQQVQGDHPSPLPDFWFSLGGEEEEEGEEPAQGNSLGSQCTDSESKASAELLKGEQQQQQHGDAMVSGDDEGVALTRVRSRRALPPLVIPDCEEEAWIAAEASAGKESLAQRQAALPAGASAATVPAAGATSPLLESSRPQDSMAAMAQGSSPSGGVAPHPSASSGNQLQELLPVLLPLILAGQGPCLQQRSSGGSLSQLQLLSLLNFLHGADAGTGSGQRQLKELVLLLLKSHSERGGSVDVGVVIQLLSALGSGESQHSQHSRQTHHMGGANGHMGGANGAMAVLLAQLLVRQSQQQDWAAPSQSGELPSASKLASAQASPAAALPPQRDFASSAPSSPATSTAGDRPSLKASEAALLASLCSSTGSTGKSAGELGAVPEAQVGGLHSQSVGIEETPPLVSAVLPVLQQLRTQLLQRHLQQLAQQERSGNNNMASLAAILSTLLPQQAAAAPPPQPQTPSSHELASLLPLLIAQLPGNNDSHAMGAVLQMALAQGRSDRGQVHSSPLPTLLAALLEAVRGKSSEARSRQQVGSPSMHTGASAVGSATGHGGPCSPVTPAHASVSHEIPPNTPVAGPSRADLQRQVAEQLRARILLALASAESRDKLLPALKSPSSAAVPKDFSAPSMSVDGSSAFVGENEGPMSPSFGGQRSQIQQSA